MLAIRNDRKTGHTAFAGHCGSYDFESNRPPAVPVSIERVNETSFSDRGSSNAEFRMRYALCLNATVSLSFVCSHRLCEQNKKCVSQQRRPADERSLRKRAIVIGRGRATPVRHPIFLDDERNAYLQIGHGIRDHCLQSRPTSVVIVANVRRPKRVIRKRDRNALGSIRKLWLTPFQPHVLRKRVGTWVGSQGQVID